MIFLAFAFPIWAPCAEPAKGAPEDGIAISAQGGANVEAPAPGSAAVARIDAAWRPCRTPETTTNADAVERILEARAQGRYADVARCLEAELKFLQHGTLAEAHILSYLGDAYQSLGRFLEAERAYRRCIRTCRIAGPSGQGLLAGVLNSLGSYYVETDKLGLARQTLQEALAVFKELPDQDPELLVSILLNLATATQWLGDFAGASDFYLHALSVCRGALGPRSRPEADLLANLATLRFAERRFDEAADTMEEALEILRASLGSSHPTVGLALTNLAAFRSAQGRLQDAETAADQALEILESTLPADHPSLAVLLEHYAWILAKTARGSQARRMRQRAREIQKTSRRENLLDHTIDVSALAVKP
jgi:tetratricopeptide (TPR) repeat protein